MKYKLNKVLNHQIHEILPHVNSKYCLNVLKNFDKKLGLRLVIQLHNELYFRVRRDLKNKIISRHLIIDYQI